MQELEDLNQENSELQKPMDTGADEEDGKEGRDGENDARHGRAGAARNGGWILTPAWGEGIRGVDRPLQAAGFRLQAARRSTDPVRYAGHRGVSHRRPACSL